MKVSFGGLGEQVATFFNSASAAASDGERVKVSGNGEVSACSAGDRFFGVALAADSDFAAVQAGGFVTLPYSGQTAPAVGYATLSADGEGGVAVDEDGWDYLVLEVDTTAGTVGFLL